MTLHEGDRVRLVGEVAKNAANLRRLYAGAEDGNPAPLPPGERGTVEVADVGIGRAQVRWDNGRTDFVPPEHLEQLDPVEWLAELDTPSSWG